MKLGQTQHTKTRELARKDRHKRKPYTSQMASHLSDRSGGMFFFCLGGSYYVRTSSSWLPHQLSHRSGGENLPISGDTACSQSGERDRPRRRQSVLTIRENASIRDGDGLRVANPLESTRKWFPMSPVSGEEHKWWSASRTLMGSKEMISSWL